MADQSLAAFFGVDNIDFKLVDPQLVLKSTAHLVVDVQKDFVHPRKWGTTQSYEVAQRIKPLTESFRDAGIQPYWVYYKERGLLLNRFKRASRCYGGFYDVRPKRDDPVIGKTAADVFEGSDIDAVLQNRGIRNLLVSGFNTSMCVGQTVQGALAHDYNVCVLSDMTENGAMPACASATLRALEEKGALVADSACVLEYVAGMMAKAKAVPEPEL